MKPTQTRVIQLLALATVVDARLFGNGGPGDSIFRGGFLDKFLSRPILQQPTRKRFERISSFLVCSQLDPTCNVDNETSAEIIVASKDGTTLYYTDGPLEVLGIVNITDPYNPVPGGVLDMGGEPTSTAVVYDWILVAVDTSPNYTNPSGNLKVIDPETMEIVRTFDLEGQVSRA
jgi:hypothetical protein